MPLTDLQRAFLRQHSHNASQIVDDTGQQAISPESGYNVLSHGAVGDGTTEDTTAIQASFNQVANAGGGQVFFPDGHTFISGPLSVPPGVAFGGSNGQSYYNATSTLPNSASISTLKLKAGSAGPLISPNDGGTNIATAVRISNINLDGGGVAQPVINLPDQGGSISRFWLMDKVYINNVSGGSGSAVYIGNQNTGVAMRDCVVFNGTSGSAAGHDGVTWYGADGYMENCYIGYFSNTGLTLLGGANFETFVMVGGGVFTCTTGVVVGGEGPTLYGVSIDHNRNDGIYAGYGFRVISCQFHTNSTQTTNTWSNIKIDANNVRASVIGCYAPPHTGETGNAAKYFIDTVGHTGIVLQQYGNIATETFGTGYTDYVGTVTAPGFPASTVAVKNTVGADVTVFIANGTSAITQITVGTTVTGMQIAASGWASIRLPQGQAIKFTYAGGAPAWTWVIG